MTKHLIGDILVLFIVGLIPLAYVRIEKTRFRDSKRLAALSLGLAIAIILALWCLLLRKPALGWDFPGFYIAGSVPVHSVHDRAAALTFAKTHLGPTGVTYFPPFMRPAIFAVLLKPLALLRYWPAFWSWFAFCFAAYLVLVVLLYKKLNLPTFALCGFAAFGPALYGIIGGQDATVIALWIGIGTLLLLRNRPTVAGMLFGLCCYKFNLVLGLPIVLALHRKWRALAAFLVTASSLAAASAWVSSPKQYENMLRNGASYCIDPQFAGLRGLLESIHAPWSYPVIAIALALICAYFIYTLPFDKALALSIVAGIFLSPHCAWYDFSVLVVPVAVVWRYLKERIQWDTFFLISQPVLWLCFGRVAELVLFLLFLKAVGVRFGRIPLADTNAYSPGT